MNVNTIIFGGRITSAPELKALPSGQNVANFSVASNDSYTKDGEKVENTEFGNVVVYGKQAENCAKYLVKGQEVLVEGKIQTRSWDKDGTKMYRTEIIARSVQFGSKPNNSDSPEPEVGDPSAVPF